MEDGAALVLHADDGSLHEVRILAPATSAGHHWDQWPERCTAQAATARGQRGRDWGCRAGSGRGCGQYDTEPSVV